MALWDEPLSGSLITASALVVGGFVLRRLAPIIGPGISAFALSGLQLFAEAEFEMQDGIISELAKQAVDQLLATVADSGASHAPPHAAREIIGRFEHSARARSERHGWHERDKRARYRHHVRKLKEALAHASRDLSSEKREYLAHASATISEDW